MTAVTVTTDVDVELSELHTDDLLEELRSRGLTDVHTAPDGRDFQAALLSDDETKLRQLARQFVTASGLIA